MTEMINQLSKLLKNFVPGIEPDYLWYRILECVQISPNIKNWPWVSDQIWYLVYLFDQKVTDLNQNSVLGYFI